MRAAAIALLICALSACSTSSSDDAAPEAAAASPDPANTATVSGQVVVDGAVAPAGIIRLDGDPKCVALAAGEERRAETVVVGSGNRLTNAFIYVKAGLPARMYPVPAEPVVLDQQKCRYVPRVLGIQVGQVLTIRNSDPLLHNVRSDGSINEPFDIGTPVQGMEVTRTFVTREVMVPFKCNVHAWMNAYLGVLEHPYFAVSDDAGRFTLPKLPPGTYTLEVWHEHFGTQTRQVTVAADQTEDVTFTYRAS